MAWFLVTGGSRGLGAALCYSLAQEGYNLVIHYKDNHEAAASVVACCKQYDIEALAIALDFAGDGAAAELVTRLREHSINISGIVNNAAAYSVGSLFDTTEQELSLMMKVNALAPIGLVKELRSDLIVNRGTVINIGQAGLNKRAANSYNTAYTMSKEVLLQATKSFAKELAPYGIRVNMVSPGHLEGSADLPQFVDKIPMGRPGLYSDVVQLILYLISPAAVYVSGQNIDVTGAAFL